MAAPLFYNQGDQELYKQFQYLPQEQFRLDIHPGGRR